MRELLAEQGITINANTNSQAAGNTWSGTDIIVIPIAQFKNTVGGADADQIRFLNDGVWAKTPCKWSAIKVGHEVLLFAIQGAILGIWR